MFKHRLKFDVQSKNYDGIEIDVSDGEDNLINVVKNAFRETGDPELSNSNFAIFGGNNIRISDSNIIKHYHFRTSTGVSNLSNNDLYPFGKDNYNGVKHIKDLTLYNESNMPKIVILKTLIMRSGNLTFFFTCYYDILKRFMDPEESKGGELYGFEYDAEIDITSLNEYLEKRFNREESEEEESEEKESKEKESKENSDEDDYKYIYKNSDEEENSEESDKINILISFLNIIFGSISGFIVNTEHDAEYDINNPLKYSNYGLGDLDEFFDFYEDGDIDYGDRNSTDIYLSNIKFETSLYGDTFAKKMYKFLDTLDSMFEIFTQLDGVDESTFFNENDIQNFGYITPLALRFIFNKNNHFGFKFLMKTSDIYHFVSSNCESINTTPYYEEMIKYFSDVSTIGTMFRRGNVWPYKELKNYKENKYTIFQDLRFSNPKTSVDYNIAKKVVDSELIKVGDDVVHLVETIDENRIIDRLNEIFPKIAEKIEESSCIFAGGALSICTSEYLWNKYKEEEIKTDIDIFIYGESLPARKKTLSRLIEEFSATTFVDKDQKVIIPDINVSRSVVSFSWNTDGEEVAPSVQLINTDSKHYYEILYNFDMSHIQIGYSNGTIYYTPEYLHYTYRKESLIIRNSVRLHRLVKCMVRGFTPVMIIPYTNIISTYMGFHKKVYLYNDVLTKIFPMYEGNNYGIEVKEDDPPKLVENTKYAENTYRGKNSEFYRSYMAKRVNKNGLYIFMENESKHNNSELGVYRFNPNTKYVNKYGGTGIIKELSKIKYSGKFRNAFDGYIGNSMGELNISTELVSFLNVFYKTLTIEDLKTALDLDNIGSLLKNVGKRFKASKVIYRNARESEIKYFNDNLVFIKNERDEFYEDYEEYDDLKICSFNYPVVFGEKDKGYFNIVNKNSKDGTFSVFNIQDIIKIVISHIMSQFEGGYNAHSLNGQTLHFKFKMFAIVSTKLKMIHLDETDSPIMSAKLDNEYNYDALCKVRKSGSLYIDQFMKYYPTRYMKSSENRENIYEFYNGEDFLRSNSEIDDFSDYVGIFKQTSNIRENESKTDYADFRIPVIDKTGWLIAKPPENFSFIEDEIPEEQSSSISANLR